MCAPVRVGKRVSVYYTYDNYIIILQKLFKFNNHNMAQFNHYIRRTRNLNCAIHIIFIFRLHSMNIPFQISISHFLSFQKLSRSQQGDIIWIRLGCIIASGNSDDDLMYHKSDSFNCIGVGRVDRATSCYALVPGLCRA